MKAQKEKQAKKYAEMRSNEREILKDENFVRRLRNYTHEDIVERITHAWLDTDDSTIDEQDYTAEFIAVCEFIIRSRYYESVEFTNIDDIYENVSSASTIAEENCSWKNKKEFFHALTHDESKIFSIEKISECLFAFTEDNDRTIYLFYLYDENCIIESMMQDKQDFWELAHMQEQEYPDSIFDFSQAREEEIKKSEIWASAHSLFDEDDLFEISSKVW